MMLAKWICSTWVHNFNLMIEAQSIFNKLFNIVNCGSKHIKFMCFIFICVIAESEILRAKNEGCLPFMVSATAGK